MSQTKATALTGIENDTPAKRHRTGYNEEVFTRTRLFRISGMPMVICMHVDHGFHTGTFDGKPLWSAHERSHEIIQNLDPDIGRIVSSWRTEESARADLRLQLSLLDSRKIELFPLVSDLGISQQIDNIDIIARGPVHLCSVEMAYRITRKFPPADWQKLPKTTYSR